MTTDVHTAPDAVAAPPGVRIGAAAVDLLVVGTAALVVSALLGAVLPLRSGGGMLQWIAVASALVAAPLWEVLTRAHGGTLGKRFAGIEVRGADGSVPSAGRTWWRSVVRLAAALPLGAGFLVALGDPSRRTLADRAASTVVVRRAVRAVPVPALPLPAWDASRLAGPPRWEQVARPLAVAAGPVRASATAGGERGPSPTADAPWERVTTASSQPPTEPGDSGAGEGVGQEPAEGGGGSFGGSGSFGDGGSFGGGSSGGEPGGFPPGDEGSGQQGGAGGGDPASRPASPPGAASSTPAGSAPGAQLGATAPDPNVVAIEQARLGGESAAWLVQVVGQVDLRLDRINRGWRSAPGAEAAPAVAFGLLLGHLARIYPHMRHDLERTAESHPSYSTLGSGGRLVTLEQLATDRSRLAAWLGPLVGTADADRVASVLD